MSGQEREALEDFKRGRYGDTAPEVSAFKAGYRAARDYCGEHAIIRAERAEAALAAREEPEKAAIIGIGDVVNGVAKNWLFEGGDEGVTVLPDGTQLAGGWSMEELRLIAAAALHQYELGFNRGQAAALVAREEPRLDPYRLGAEATYEELRTDADSVTIQREDLRWKLDRIRACAESDADLPVPLRDFLLRESTQGVLHVTPEMVERVRRTGSHLRDQSCECDSCNQTFPLDAIEFGRGGKASCPECRPRHHPDPAINVEVGRDAAHGELKDLGAGYLPRAWRCPCGEQHGRGPLPTGEHRCLACGYIGFEGVMRDGVST